MRKTITLWSLLIAAGFAMPAQAANECRLKYRAGSTSYSFQDINAGATATLNKLGLTEALNDGGHDIFITLESTGFNGQVSSSTTTLVRSANLTLVLPPMLFNGMKLKSAHCRQFATITDTQQYLSQFGSATQVVNAATAAAQGAAQQAQAAAVAAFNANHAGQLQQDAQAALAEANQLVQQAQQGTQAAVAVTQANFAAHFPELHTAITSTLAYRYDLNLAAREQDRNNLLALQQQLQRLDQKYRVSQAGQALIRVDMAVEFPEVHALGRQSCNFTPPPVLAFDAQSRAFRDKLAELLVKYTPALPPPAVPEFRLDAPTKALMERTISQSSACLSKSAQDYVRSREDLREFTAHVRDARRELDSIVSVAPTKAVFDRVKGPVYSAFLVAANHARDAAIRIERDIASLNAVHDALAKPLDDARRGFAAFDPAARPAFRIAADGTVTINLAAIQTPLQTAAMERETLGVFAAGNQLTSAARDWATRWGALASAHQAWTDVVREMRPHIQQAGALDPGITNGVRGIFDRFQPLVITAREINAIAGCGAVHGPNWQAAAAELKSYHLRFWSNVPGAAVAGAAQTVSTALQIPADIHQQMRTTLAAADALQKLPMPRLEAHALSVRSGVPPPQFTPLPYPQLGIGALPSLGDVQRHGIVFDPTQLANLVQQLARLESVASTASVLAGSGLQELNARAQAQHAEAARMDQQLRSSAAAAGNLGREATALAGLIGRAATQPQRDINELQAAALGIDKLRAMNWNHQDDVSACTGQLAQASGAAVQTFGPRASAFLDRRTQALLNAVPADVLAALTDLLAKTGALLPAYASFIQKGLAVPPAAAALSTSLVNLQFPAVVSALPGPGGIALNVPMPDVQSRVAIGPSGGLVARTQDTQAKLLALTNALDTFKRAGTDMQTAQAQYAQSRRNFELRLGQYTTGLPSDIAQLGVAGSNRALEWTEFMVTVHAEVDKSHNLAPKWQAALSATPARLAALTPAPAVSAQVQQTLLAGRDFIQQRGAALASCLTTAVARQASIGHASQVSAAVNQTVAGLQTEAQGVINSLNSLLPPGFNTLGQVSGVLQSAASLTQRVTIAGQAATQRFNSAIATLRADMQTASACVTTQHTQVISRRNELRSAVGQSLPTPKAGLPMHGG